MIGRFGAGLLVAVSFLATAPATVHAHGGGLNAEGCHNNRRTGEYHCHRSGYSPPRYVPAPTAPQPLYAPSRGMEAGSSCAKDAAVERTACQEKRRADRERIATMEQHISDLKDQVKSLRAEVDRLRRERQGYFP